MKIAALYSHLNGHEWMLVHEKSIWEEIENIITSLDANQYRTKISKEKTMKGRRLISPIEINNVLKKQFNAANWNESRTSYWVTDDHKLIRSTLSLTPQEQKAEIQAADKTPIYSYNQTDFIKRRIAVEVQLEK